jgi:hypothetical protein
MEKPTGIVDEITEDEYEALAELDGRTEEARTEYAVVYFRRGKPFAEGPFEERRLAEVRVHTSSGVIAERQVVTNFGPWAESPKPAEEKS